MNTLKNKSGVWFVYDGECPICRQTAKALKIKQHFGELHTLDARATQADPLIEEIDRLAYDLDEGMVIFHDGQFYHGKNALMFIAKYGESKNLFMTFFKGFFWSDRLSNLVYPWLRGARNLLLKRRGVAQIDNLQLKNEPIFKSIFGESWGKLPPVMKNHYANRPYTKDESAVAGRVDIMCKAPLLWLSPLLKLLGQIPIANETNVPVVVHFRSGINSKSFEFNRTFNLSKQKPYKFRSRMRQISDDIIIEMMRFGIAWKARCFWDGEKVILSHEGFALQIFGHLIPLPLTIFMGSVYAEERPVNDKAFDMVTHITHPWWGKVYEYKGRFEVLS